MTTPKPIQPSKSVAAESTMVPESSAQIDATIQDAIGRRLRDSYDQIVNEKVPDALFDVLKRLKKKEEGDITGET